MSKLLKLYNSNEYLGLCISLIDGINNLQEGIIDIKINNRFSEIDSLLSLCKATFEQENVAQYIEYTLTKVLKPHYLGNVQKLTKGNSNWYLNFKIVNEEISLINEIYGGVLSNILRLYKRLITVVNFSHAELSVESLEKFELLLKEAEKKLSESLDYKRNRKLIEQREKLKEETIKNLPYPGFYHMTHISNLKSILDEGLLSTLDLRSKGISNHDISNHEIKRQRDRNISITNNNILEYVPLYINPTNPMMKSDKIQEDIDSIVLLEVIPHILVQEEGSLFTDGNAAYENTNFFNNQEEMENINWEMINEGKWIIKGKGHSEMCTEVLVKNVISPKYINRIILRNSNKLHDLMTIFPNHKGIEIVINSDIYSFKYN